MVGVGWVGALNLQVQNKSLRVWIGVQSVGFRNRVAGSEGQPEV